MKRYIISTFFLILFVLSVFGEGETLKNKVGNTNLIQISNKNLIDYNLLKQTEDKVTIIEFWEIWCAPCISSMHHLKKLKEKFPNELEIICVSTENLEKTKTFIEKNNFPFTFIYDKDKHLKEQVFPHTGIPHSILVDKKGVIQMATHPKFVKEEVINRLINGQQIDVPEKTFFDPKLLSEDKSKNTLIKFELRNYQLGDRGYVETSSTTRSRKLITDISGEYKDTLENVLECKAAGQNILELYQIAYDGLSKARFIYDENLSYINSQKLDRLYTMLFLCSDLLGKPNEILINQLNTTFGLKTNIHEKEVEVLILDSIMMNTENIKKSFNKNKAGMNLMLTLSEYKIESSYLSSDAIAKTLEDFFNIPVENEVFKDNFYEIDLKIENEPTSDANTGILTKDIDVWINLFKKQGIILRKDKKILKLVEISSL